MAQIEVFPTRADLYTVLPKNAIGAELGVRFGENAKILRRVASPKLLHLIDIWDGPTAWEQVNNRFADRPRFKIHRATTRRASREFGTEYFDWIYVDADHRYVAVLDDLRTYHSKVKKGGLVLGHDFFNHTGVQDGVSDGMGVIRAVLECVADGLYEFMYLTKERWPSYGLKRL